LPVRTLAAVLALAACSKSDPLPADCTTVANGVKRYWDERALQTSDPDELAAIGETERAAIEKLERHCVADHWNDDMIACTRAVFRLEDSGCMKFLSMLQKSKLLAADEAPKIHGGMGVGR
jgi:hypothetical protein